MTAHSIRTALKQHFPNATISIQPYSSLQVGDGVKTVRRFVPGFGVRVTLAEQRQNLRSGRWSRIEADIDTVKRALQLLGYTACHRIDVHGVCVLNDPRTAQDGLTPAQADWWSKFGDMDNPPAYPSV